MTPYRVAIWTTAVNPADFDAGAEAQLHREITNGAAAYMGAPCTVEAAAVPDELAGEIVTRLDEMTVEPVLSSSERALGFDKVMLVRLSRESGDWAITVREFDTQTYQLSPSVTRTVSDRSQLASGILSAVVEAFSPLVLLNKVEGSTAQGRVRAAALATDDASPVLVSAGDALLPIVRMNDRLGRASPQSVRAVDWTVLEVASRDGGRLKCEIHSAQRNPLSSRARLRLMRYGLAVHPPQRNTRLVLQTPGDQSKPLVDYEVVQHDSKTDKVESLGRTDRAGELEISWVDRPWRQLYVRHGEQLLARLPMIPGWRERLVVPLPSDDVRLAAEGVVSALKQDVVDTVARRQIVASRFRYYLSEGEFDKAENLLAEFRNLQDHRAFDRRLSEARTQLVADNARAQQHIDSLFAETQQVLRRYLDPGELGRLESQLAQARQGG